MRNMLRFLILILTICIASVVVTAQRPRNQSPLTNAEIVRLAKAGFKEKSILSIIAVRPANYDLSTERMIELKRNGVSERIILAMLSTQLGTDLAFDPFDDSFSTSEIDGKRRGELSQLPPDRSSTDIFGSSGGVKGESRTNGINGSAVDDTVTTGSATVRILKPPAEANTPAKLERKPTLNNNSIVDLVEAGFSEGTIVRRIEQSPVDFDLSPAQLNELRKRRVSDRLLVAMHTAMGVDPTNMKNTANANEKARKNK